jgi:hydroxypyruvate isomerase
MNIIMKRRSLLKALAATPVLAAQVSAAQEEGLGPRQGRIKQSVMPQVWTGTDFSFEERCEILSLMGFVGMDLAQPQQVPVLNDYGLTPTLMGGRIGTGTSFQDGLIRRELHDQIEEEIQGGLEMCVEAGCKNLIAFPGERRGMSREEGKDNAIEILSRVAPYAEAAGVNVCMEITNSKVEADNRTDQVFDDIHWGFDVCRGTGSPNITVVYDFYHVQIANGDVVRTMLENLDHISHMHVAGVPSRREIDRTQELDYRWIAQQIADSGYDDFVAHEYRPTEGRNPLVSLAVGYDIMTVY